MRRAYGVMVAALVALATAVGFGQGADRLTSETFQGLELRSLGPSLTTGRVADVAIDPNHSNIYYVASAAGGVWKSDDRGNNWKSIFDNGGSFNMCCIVVDPKNSDILWLGTGENSNPRSAMYGDGLYKSSDAGATWKRVGLEHSEHIGRIQIDPRNSNVVYVASQGPLWSSGGDRGIYKTTDGGTTWKQVLSISPDTGGNDLVIDPNNPDVIYASTWQRRRGVGQFIGGGPESGVFKSINAGEKWTKLTTGLPKGDMGRIALGVDPKAKPTRVYVLANALGAERGFYRSDDAGATFVRTGAMSTAGRRGGGAPGGAAAAGRRGGGGAAAGTTPPARGAQAPSKEVAKEGALTPNTSPCAGGGGQGGGGDAYCGGDPGYYNELIVDPIRPDTIWSTDTNLEWSQDGGRTWSDVPNLNGVHVDYHAVAPDPKDINHIIVGNDGGLYESWNNGRNWRHFASLPITQFYRVALDNAKPFYNVCGGAQDNGSMCGPSRTVNRVGIRTSDWYVSGGGDGFFSAVDPEDPNWVYASSQNGAITRLDLRTGQTKGIRPPQSSGGGRGGGGGGGRGGGGTADRTNWDDPYIISPHSATRLYWGSDKLYRSDDRGDNWTVISPDLTRALSPEVIPIMGKVWDPKTTVSWNEATTTLSTIVTIDESPLLEGLIYVGTDDGLLQVTEDGGKTWRKMDTFPGVPVGTYLTKVFASPRDSNVVFVALNNWQKGDYKPYLVRSDDRGRTFKSIAGNLPDRYDVWSVAQDHVNGDLLFAGTEWGLFFSPDAGAHWVQLKGGIPTAQVRDMKIQQRENDLVLATFGRGFYVLDDYSPLREVTAATLGQDAALFPLRTAYAFDEHGYTRAVWGNEATPNPPMGAVFTYNVAAGFSGELVLSIADATGKQIQRLTLATTPGMHRVTWNLREEPQGGAGAGGGRGGGGGGGRGGGGGPMVAAGRYTATIGKPNGDQLTAIGKPQSFTVAPLPGGN
jgi:photosystem II stability/assembly factor-like uncharacterized protein